MRLAVILAGGHGVRLGRANKALVMVGGKKLIRHVVDRIAPQADGMAVNCAPGEAELDALGLPIVPDAEASADRKSVV